GAIFLKTFELNSTADQMGSAGHSISLESRTMSFPISFRHQGFKVGSNDLVLPVAENRFCALVPRDDFALLVRENDCIGSGLHNRTESKLRSPKFLLLLTEFL